MEVFEGAQISRLDVLWILECDDVFSAELLVVDEISPHLRFDVQAFNCVVCEDIAGVLQGYNMRVVCEDLVGDRIHHLALIILAELELDQFIALQRLSRDWICAMFQEPW